MYLHTSSLFPKGNNTASLKAFNTLALSHSSFPCFPYPYPSPFISLPLWYSGSPIINNEGLSAELYLCLQDPPFFCLGLSGWRGTVCSPEHSVGCPLCSYTEPMAFNLTLTLTFWAAWISTQKPDSWGWYWRTQGAGCLSPLSSMQPPPQAIST